MNGCPSKGQKFILFHIHQKSISSQIPLEQFIIHPAEDDMVFIRIHTSYKQTSLYASLREADMRAHAVDDRVQDFIRVALVSM